MLKKFIVVGMFMTLSFIPFAKAAEMKLGVVNMQEVLETVEEGKKAKAVLESAFTDKKKELEGKQKAFEKLKESYEKQKLVLSTTALADKQKELEMKASELQRANLAAHNEMQKKELEITGDIIKKIQAVVTKVGKDGGYTFVWEKSQGGVVYSKDGTDVTAQVIAEYNKAYKK